jgi:uncharacterized protein (DUF2344 family)
MSVKLSESITLTEAQFKEYSVYLKKNEMALQQKNKSQKQPSVNEQQNKNQKKLTAFLKANNEQQQAKSNSKDQLQTDTNGKFTRSI